MYTLPYEHTSSTRNTFTFTELNTIHIIRFVFILVFISTTLMAATQSTSAKRDREGVQRYGDRRSGGEGEGERETMIIGIYLLWLFLLFYVYVEYIVVHTICRRISFHQCFSNGRTVSLKLSNLWWLFGFVCLFLPPSISLSFTFFLFLFLSRPFDSHSVPRIVDMCVCVCMCVRYPQSHSLTFPNTHAIDYMYTPS